MDYTVVIKVKYAETLRRFNARIVDGEFDLNMDRLRDKIVGLFKFSPDSELTMTYVDEDNDIVTLADDEDLCDVVRQGLNPLRITVKLSAERNGKSSSRTSGASTPLRSPRVQQPSQNFKSEILSSIPEPLRRIVTSLATEMLSSSVITPATSLQHLLEMCPNQLSGHQAGPDATAYGGASGGTTNGSVSQDTGGPKINEAGDVAVIVPAAVATANIMSDDRSKKVFTNSKPELVAVPTSDVLSDDQSRMFFSNSKPEAGSDPGKVKSGLKGSARTIPGLEDVRAALDSVSESASSQSDVGKNKLIKLSPYGAPSISKSVPGEKMESCEKSTPSNVPNPACNPFSLPAIPGPWSNLNIQPTTTPSRESNRKTFGCGSGNSSTSNPVPSPMSECPFTGMPEENSSVHPAQTHLSVAQSRRNQRQGDGPVLVFHRGVRCDGCGVHPITGTRFKSKVKEDYDLCTFCFGQMGNEEDYIRMDRPMTYRHPYSFKCLHDLHTRGNPVHPQVFRGCGLKPSRSKLDSHFIQDMNVSDGTLMAPLTPFTKIWRMRNNGAVVWPQGTQLAWIGGDKFTNAFSVEVEIPHAGVPVDKELDIAVDFVAPRYPGKYISYWRMASPSGQKFGQRVWVLIQVDANELPPESFRNFNLNLPPVSNGISNPEIINVNPEPIVEDGLSELGAEFVSVRSNRMVDLVDPIVDLPVQKEQELNFPTNDSLLVGGAVSRPNPAAPSSPSVSYPIVELSEVAPSSVPPPVPVSALFTGVQTLAEDVELKNEVEETLLKDLEEMGFKQVDLNKEILRLNEYDLEKSVDDLCGVSEWDPILEELNEMGFGDKERNKKLLKKNNGSIKRVVMDLIAGEK